jgi:prepilin-type N-terminal cleavage/methylation domain-containing protein
MKTRLSSNVDGFTLAEMLVVLAIAGVLMAAAIIVMPGVLGQGRSDGGTAQALNALRLARDRAIGERRNIEVRFLGTNHIQTVRDEIGAGGVAAGTTIVADVYLEAQQFLQFTGIKDTPDLFHHATSTGALDFGPTPTYMFTSEGTFIDSTGDVLNGTLFLGYPGNTLTARAITFFGPTALLHVWKWNGSSWID